MVPQADINQQADEFEEQLLRSRQDMEVRSSSSSDPTLQCFAGCCKRCVGVDSNVSV